MKMSSDDDDEDTSTHSGCQFHPGDGDGEAITETVIRWSLAKETCHPTQRALGWDWTFFKLSHFVTFDDAQAYMTRKPVPVVAYRGRDFIVDHHHTLVRQT